jgi:hypothetical protein
MFTSGESLRQFMTERANKQYTLSDVLTKIGNITNEVEILNLFEKYANDICNENSQSPVLGELIKIINKLCEPIPKSYIDERQFMFNSACDYVTNFCKPIHKYNSAKSSYEWDTKKASERARKAHEEAKVTHLQNMRIQEEHNKTRQILLAEIEKQKVINEAKKRIEAENRAATSNLEQALFELNVQKEIDKIKMEQLDKLEVFFSKVT